MLSLCVSKSMWSDLKVLVNTEALMERVIHSFVSYFVNYTLGNEY